MADSLQLDGTKLSVTQKLANGSMHAGQMNGLDGMNRSTTDAGPSSRTKSKNASDKSAKQSSKAGYGNDKASTSTGAVAANSLLPASASVALTLATKNGCDVSATISYQVLYYSLYIYI